MTIPKLCEETGNIFVPAFDFPVRQLAPRDKKKILFPTAMCNLQARRTGFHSNGDVVVTVS